MPVSCLIWALTLSIFLTTSPLYGQVSCAFIMGEKSHFEVGRTIIPKELEDSISNQFKIVENDSFDTKRTLEQYDAEFSAMLKPLLKDLKDGDTWVDFGAGEMSPLLTHLTGGPNEAPGKGTMIALGFNLLETAWTRYYEAAGRLIRREGRIEDLEVNKVIPKKYTLGTDVYAFGSYTPYLVEALTIQINKMSVNESHFLSNAEAKIETLRGPLRLRDWLNTIPGLKMQRASILGSGFILKKTQPEVTLPSLLLKEFTVGRPPKRVYVELPPE